MAHNLRMQIFPSFKMQFSLIKKKKKKKTKQKSKANILLLLFSFFLKKITRPKGALDDK